MWAGGPPGSPAPTSRPGRPGRDAARPGRLRRGPAAALGRARTPVLFLTARDATEDKLPAVEDQAWFFDTELLLAAQRGGLRIHEVPVDCVEDTDSRVDVVRTALDNLRGMARVARQQLPSFAASRGSSTPSRTVNQATVTAKES